MAVIKLKRGTQAQLDAAATANGLSVGEPYFVTDVGYVAVGSAVNAYEIASKNMLVVLESTDPTPDPGDYPDGTLVFRKH